MILALETKSLFKLSFANLAHLRSGGCPILIIILWSQSIHGDDAVLVHQINIQECTPSGGLCALEDAPSCCGRVAKLAPPVMSKYLLIHKENKSDDCHDENLLILPTPDKNTQRME